MIPFPNKKYAIIYADPPWNYSDKWHPGKRGAMYKYNMLEQSTLIDLPVLQIAEDDSILFLWVTMPMLQNGLDVIKSWGFSYKTAAFTWVKKNKKKDSYFFWHGLLDKSKC